MTELAGPEQGHQFHFEVDIQGAHRSADGPYVDEEQPAGLPFRVTVRAWNLRDACLAAAELALSGWTQPDENGAGSFDLLNAAAERAHEAMHDCELAPDGIERELWQKVVLAVLDDPRLLPAWARGARVDADTWRRACSDLDAELQCTRKDRDRYKAQAVGLIETMGARTYTDAYRWARTLGETVGRIEGERDKLQARLDRVVTTCEAAATGIAIGMGVNPARWECAEAAITDVLAALQGDQPAEPEVPS